jgi:hypothetical protein
MKKFLALFLLVAAASILPAYTPDTTQNKYEYFYTASHIPVQVAQQLVGRGRYVQQIIDQQNLPHPLVKEMIAQIDTMLLLYTQTLKYDSTLIDKPKK